MPTPTPAGSPAEDDLDAARLAASLRVLASPTRIRLLRALQAPARPADLRIAASAGRAGLRSGRTLSRPAIVQHLDALAAHRLVRRAGGGFVVNQQAMVALLADLGRLARLRPLVEPEAEATLAAQAAATRVTRPPAGPRLTLVGGPQEGRTFPLEGPGPWTVGRGEGAHVRIAYDPHVSRAHAVVRRAPDGAFTLEAAPVSTNPLALDFAPLAPGVTAPLLGGSVVALGASRLVFQAA